MKKIIVCLVCLCCIGMLKAADTSHYLLDVKKELGKPWPENRTINIVFHGHSVPTGYRDHHKVNILESYPQLLLKALKEKYPYAVINIILTSIGGENSVKGAARFRSDVLIHKPDVLLIDYALNDRFVGLDKAKEAWTTMVQEATAAGVKVILLTPSPDQRVAHTPGNELEQHALQIRQLAGESGVGLADSYKVFGAVPDVKPYMATVNHPNLKGHELIAAELLKWF